MSSGDLGGLDEERAIAAGDAHQGPPGEYLRKLVRSGCSAAELKLILTIAAHGGANRAVHEAAIADDPDLLASLDVEDPPLAIREALVSAARKRLISTHSTAEGAMIVALAQDGTRGFSADNEEQTSNDLGRQEPSKRTSDNAGPTVFALYEQNISVLTPLLADRITDALNIYPEPWIRDAIGEAVYYNRRSWRYIERILQNWATEGRGDETHRRNHERHHSAGTSLRDKVAPYLRKR